jgi:hypothetical protein
MQTLIVQVSMVRATETGPQEFIKGDAVEFPAEHVQRLIERRIAIRPEATSQNAKKN